MRFGMFASALLTLAFAQPAFAAEDCSGKEGKELKDCEKANKAAEKAAKADARSTPLLPSQLHADLGKLDATNPFATEIYKVRFTPTEITKVDEYLIRAAKMKATVVFARYYVDQAAAGNIADLTAFGPTLLTLLKAVPADAEALKTEGQALVGQLPTILAGPDALKIPKITTALNDAIQQNLIPTISEAPQVVTSLTAVVPM
jgi:hypothetical protein